MGLLIAGAATVAALVAIMMMVPRLKARREQRIAAERAEGERLETGLMKLRDAEYAPELRRLPSGRVRAR